MSLLWLCPLCREPLQREGNSLQCPARHCFDYAREGYVNLLPANRKGSGEPGDNREMIEARRRVHESDLYRPLADALCSVLQALVEPGDSLLDLGCGEGYYSKAVISALPSTRIYGVDIAKAAVRFAAKACPTGHFAVASAFDIPLPAQSVSAVFSVFAPASDAELVRLLKPGGYYLKVTPGASHLWELRQLLYDTPRQHAEQPSLPAGFDTAAQSSVQFPFTLKDSLLDDLVAMTPYAYGGQREKKEKLAALDCLQTQADFVLTLYRRNEQGAQANTLPDAG